MQQQVMKRNMSSELGWGSGSEGGWGLQSSTPGSGSWTSTANQETSSSASSSWQAMGKSDSASDAGDDASSVKSGSTITNMSNMTSQSQETSSTSNSGALQTSSSSPWSTSNPTLSGMDSSPWGNSGSPAPSSIGSIGWSSNPSLSLSTNQGHNSSMPGSNLIGSNSAFSSTSAASPSTGWPASMTGSSLASTSTLPPSMSSGSGGLSSQWQGSSMLGNIGDFTKSSDSGWSNPTSSLIENKDIGGANSDPRMWGLTSDKSGEGQWDTKSQWSTTSLAGGSDQGSGGTELSFAQATLKGLKIPPTANAPQAPLNSRQEEILRAIENHEGWGSRPIRQDTSWDIENSPKSHRKFSADNNAGASNVWNNSNGTAIWEAVRENQSSNWGGSGASGNSWNAEKDQPSWGGPAKPPQDPNSWNVGNGADPKNFGTWGAAGGAGDASNKMWGQKTEVGSWGETGGVQRTTSISSWGDDGEGGSWEDQRRITGSMGNMQGMVPPSPGMSGPTGMPGMVPQGMPGMNMATMGSEPTPWNDGQKVGWNPANAAAVNRPKMDEPWNKPPPVRTGWGDPAQDALKVDDGTSIWAANAPKQLPPQAKASGWGDTGPQGQWNAAVGAKPKAPAGWDEASWALQQRAKSGRYPEDDSANSVEVGYWNGLPQDNNTWNDPAALRGVRKITGQQMPPKYMGTGSNPPTQMRSKLLQHLMDIGFRKEEAQHALITNNMNLEMAINDLKANNGVMSRKDLEMDMFQANGSQSRMPYMPKGGLGGDDMTDLRPDQVPTFNNLQNTPFPNAQVPNQTFMQSNASLPPSSLNPNNSSINASLQQKLMQKMQQQQAPPTAALGPRGQMPPVGSGANNQVPQQQQQQILAQLRQAVSNGFISPQLLNYQLPHNILVLLQQLLQLQTALQTAMNKQQQMMQQVRATGNRSNPHLEQMPGIINNINQQIINLQKQLQQAQNNLFSSQKPPMPQPPSGTMTPQPGQQPGGNNMVDNLDALSSDLANVALQSQQSRLTTQWKSGIDANSANITDGLATPTTTIGNAIDENSEKAVGGKGLLQSSSSPNLNLIPGGLGMTGDKTWSSNMSTTSSSNWPLSSSDNTGTNSQADLKVTNPTTSSTSSIISGIQSGFTDVIPEFVPGKPWQGLAKNVEDDPHVTPGSIQLQRSLSVNRVHDESLNNLDGHKLNSSSTWSTSLKNDSLGLSQLGSRPPPGMAPAKAGNQQWQTGSNFSRQTSWPHSSNSAFTKVGASNWNDSRGSISSWVLLKNLNSAAMDSTTVRALCAQHGTLVNFHYIAQGQLALVQYSSRDVAFMAQQRLNNFQIGISVITAEFINEVEAQRVASQIPPPQQSAMPPMNASPWSQAPPAPFQPTPMRGGDPWGNSMQGAQQMSKYSSGGGDPWGLWDMSDHNSNPLFSNILGSESM